MSRVTEVRFVGYGCTDLAAEREFYRGVWGVKPVAERDGMSYFTMPNGFAVEYTSPLEAVDHEHHEAGVMDQWEVGTGGARTIPHPEPCARLFLAVGV